MLSLLYWALAAISNACMDRVENENYFNSVFKYLPSSFAYKRDSWDNTALIPGTKYRPDLWHLAKSAMIVFFALSVLSVDNTIYYVGPFPEFGLVYGLCVYGLAWHLPFNLFYNRIFKI